MFVNLNIPSFCELLWKFVFSFKTKLLNLTTHWWTVLSHLLYHYLVQYGPGGMIFLTHTHNNIVIQCVEMINVQLRLILTYFIAVCIIWGVLMRCMLCFFKLLYYYIIMDFESVNKRLLYSENITVTRQIQCTKTNIVDILVYCV